MIQLVHLSTSGNVCFLLQERIAYAYLWTTHYYKYDTQKSNPVDLEEGKMYLLWLELYKYMYTHTLTADIKLCIRYYLEAVSVEYAGGDWLSIAVLMHESDFTPQQSDYALSETQTIVISSTVIAEQQVHSTQSSTATEPIILAQCLVINLIF